MLRILGTPRALCDGVSRRELLHIGSLGMLGVSLAGALQHTARAGESAAAHRSPLFGRARSCILVFPYGSPSQHETFDPKPDAPAEIQGEMKAIPSAVPGLAVCDRLPRVAGITDRLTVVRSVTHPYPVHGVAYAVTGMPEYTPELETRPRDARHWPFIGSLVDYLDERRTGVGLPEVPRNIGLPWLLNSRTDLDVSAGPYAAFLGAAYDPVWTHFDGPGTKLAPLYTDGQKQAFMDPFAATTHEGRFHVSPAAQLPPEMSVERVRLRRSLLGQFDASRAAADLAGFQGGFDKFQAQAFSLLTTSKMREALDIGREPAEVREAYGMHLFGQSCLAARRLIEAGGRFVTVFWDGFGQFANCAWDTHNNHYPRMKEYLLPAFDQTFPTLITDLESRGLLDETLVLWLSEHGRTPQIDPKPQGAGRHHWSRVYSVALAGAGIPRGKIVGASDKLGGDVLDTPVSPKDLLATALYLLGIDPETHVHDPLGRPYRLAGSGLVRRELLDGDTA